MVTLSLRPGLCYFEGLGVEVDYGQALKLLAPAARRGLPRACYHLGRIYAGGLGVLGGRCGGEGSGGLRGGTHVPAIVVSRYADAMAPPARGHRPPGRRPGAHARHASCPI
ncbi:hypothetical protein [Anaeromyxobacter sp. PSR-1]|uniref:hypothetical protein n=1 Tax=Anaeromyxobacter sp. PSR-1 TaxID=1300915 RepID=UPI00351C4AA2